MAIGGYKGYRDLRVYKLSYQLAMEVFEITKDFPKEEKYALVDQMRRSSRSIPVNVAEAWKKRRYQKMFVSKIIDAAGEAGEMEVWLDFSKDSRYLDVERHRRLAEQYGEVNRMLFGMIDKADRFCRTK
jgi:four helix bundle protein